MKGSHTSEEMKCAATHQRMEKKDSMGSVSSLSMKLPMLIWLEDRCYATVHNAVKLFKHSDESAQKDPQKSIMTTTADYHLPDGEFLIQSFVKRL